MRKFNKNQGIHTENTHKISGNLIAPDHTDRAKSEIGGQLKSKLDMY